MLIKVKSEGHNITVPLPNGLALNPVTAAIAAAVKEVPFSAEQLNRLFGELYKAKKALGELPLVEVESANGDTVLIKL